MRYRCGTDGCGRTVDLERAKVGGRSWFRIPDGADPGRTRTMERDGGTWVPSWQRAARLWHDDHTDDEETR